MILFITENELSTLGPVKIDKKKHLTTGVQTQYVFRIFNHICLPFIPLGFLNVLLEEKRRSV